MSALVNGPLDALLNHALISVKYADQTARTGGRGVPAYNLEPGGADAALYEVLRTIAPDVARDVARTYGFELGIAAAAIVLRDPLGDHTTALRAILDKAINDEREAKRDAA